MCTKKVTISILLSSCKKSKNCVAFWLLSCTRKADISLWMDQKRSNTLPLLSHLTLLCSSKSSAFASTSFRNSLSRRCWWDEDALRKLMSFIIVFITSYTLLTDERTEQIDGWCSGKLWDQGRPLSSVPQLLSLFLPWQGLHLWWLRPLVSDLSPFLNISFMALYMSSPLVCVSSDVTPKRSSQNSFVSLWKNRTYTRSWALSVISVD